MTRWSATFLLAFAATPALAHHEVVVATSLLPLVGGIVAIVLTAIAGAQRRHRRSRIKKACHD